MSLKELICSSCGTVIRKKVGEAINLSDNPKYIKDIIEGKINFSTCPKCKEKITHKSHVLLTYMDPPRWIWLVDKQHRSLEYQEEFFRTMIPSSYENLIEQEMVFVDFGEPCQCLRYILERKQPQKPEEWIEVGKLLTGERAIDCYKNALRINNKLIEAKKLMNEELDNLKTYSL